MMFSIGKNVLSGDDKMHVIINDVGPTLKRIGQQYEEKQKTIKELRKQLNDFKTDVYKDEEMKRMKQSFDQMKSDYHRGFPITKEETKRINAWLENHENIHHGGYPCYHGVSGGGYSYNFHPTAIGTTGDIICESCRNKAIKDAAGDIKIYRDLLKKYDAIFLFQDIC